MTPQKRDAQALLQILDSIAQQHGPTNPELLRDISEHRDALQAALQANSRRDTAQAALRIATWVKFIFDFF